MSQPVMALIPLVALYAASTGPPRYDVPDGSVVEWLVDGPGDSVVASYFEPFPTDLFCGTELAEQRMDLRKVAAFDADGRLLWRTPLPILRVVQTARVLPDTSLVIWGWFRPGGGRPPDLLVARVSGAGVQALLTRSDIGAAVLTSVDVAEDGRIVVAGTFSTVRGQPRPGIARLRPDGSLDD